MTCTSLNIRLLILLVVFDPFVQYDSRRQSGPISLENGRDNFSIYTICATIYSKKYLSKERTKVKSPILVDNRGRA